MTTQTKVEVKSWASILDERTRAQADLISRVPGIAGHVALMPDAHIGIGATVGSVIPTYPDTIIPAAVGVDIGCGMMACRTDIDRLPDDLTTLVNQFGRSIPAGMGRQHKQATKQAEEWFEENPLPNSAEEVFASRKGGATRAGNYGRRQLGTLGAGNHFVEVCLDSDDAVWCLLHSGSRGIGNAIAQIFIDIAKAECTEKLEDPDTARLTGESFECYIQMMQWAQRYAYTNRELMMEAMIDDMTRFIGAFEVVDTINCHHNFAAKEVHFGREMWITRKGAIRADIGDMGIIPGSMGAATYIVEGKGEPESYKSSAHGAGRMYSRGHARNTFTVESLREYMAGKAWNARNASKLLDEHPDAYKPIEQVMADQADLVSVRTVLRQVVNYKGV